MKPSQHSSHSISRRLGRFSLATLISRILGYARDASVAHIFGGEYFTDTFYTAFRISNLFRRLLGEGALNSSFIPVFSKSLKTESRERSQEFLNALFTSLVTVLAGLTILAMIFAPQLTRLIAPGFADDPAKLDMTVKLTRWTFPFFFFISLAALASGVLNSLKNFFLPAVAPAMLSVAEIAYLFLCIPLIAHASGHFMLDDQIVGLSVSVVAGGAGHFLAQVPTIFRSGFRLGFRWDWKHPHSIQVMKLMLPAMIGLSVDQIDAFVNTICATYLVDGSVTALYNSNRLMQLPLAIFGIAIASVSLPTLAEYSAEKNYRRFAETINHGLRMILFLVTPAAVGLIFLARPVVSLLFEHGRFSSFATTLTAHALMGYCVGLVAYSMVKVLANSFYALQEPKIPVRVAVYCVLLNAILNVALMGPLGVGGLALGAAIASWANAITLYVVLRRKLQKEGVSLEIAGGSLSRTFLKSLAACAGMGLYLWALLRMTAGQGVLYIVIFGVAGGGLVYMLFCKALRVEEEESLFHMLGLRNAPSVDD